MNVGCISKQLLEWIDLRINQSHEQLDRDKSLEYTQKETLRLMAAKRQRRVELHQANMRKNYFQLDFFNLFLP